MTEQNGKWRIGGIDAVPNLFHKAIFEDNGGFLDAFVAASDDEHAPIIVRAVNAHQALVDGLEAVEQKVECPVCEEAVGVPHKPDCLIGIALRLAKEDL